MWSRPSFGRLAQESNPWFRGCKGVWSVLAFWHVVMMEHLHQEIGVNERRRAKTSPDEEHGRLKVTLVDTDPGKN